ncbi:hypothetical protein BgiBS90_018745, partial [Biomphalaria glabrata]
MRFLPKIILTVLCCCLLHRCCEGLLTNLFNYISTDGSRTIYGKACWTYNEYMPSCGWKFILISTLPITSIA